VIRALCFLALFIAGSPPQDPGTADWVPVSATPADGELSIERTNGSPPLVIPRGEELSYLVEIDIFGKGVDVGTATFKSWVEGADAASVGHLEVAFKASAPTYTLDHQLHSQHPLSGDIKLQYSDTQRGSENRRREIRVERGEEGLTSAYRSDGHCKGCEDKAHFRKRVLRKPKHCKGCDGGEHRVWREFRERTVPEDTLDFLSSIYLIRSQIRCELERIATPVLEKDKLWDLSLVRGEAKVIEVPKGKYACRKIIIDAKKPASESHEGEFSGLFGMEGSMNFWVHESTGVMVQIVGKLPFGLRVKIRLKEAKGAPEGLITKKG